MTQKTKADQVKQIKLGLTFHRTFGLVRSAISQILKIARQIETQGGEKLERQTIQKMSSLGSIYVEAMPRYARGSGLIQHSNFLTLFGNYVVENDLLLEQTGTQWIMHYYLSVSHGPGASFWNNVIANLFYLGSKFSYDELTMQIGNYVWEIDNIPPKERSIKNTASAFISTYTKERGLQKLAFLTSLKNETYKVNAPIKPPISAIGYALIDFWENHYARRLGVGLDTLLESEWAKIFMLSKSELEEALHMLQEAHYVDIHRTAPPYQVFLLRTDREPLLQNLYGISTAT